MRIVFELKLMDGRMGVPCCSLGLTSEMSNVSKACRIMGYSREQFYPFRRDYQTYVLGLSLAESMRCVWAGTDVPAPSEPRIWSAMMAKSPLGSSFASAAISLSLSTGVSPKTPMTIGNAAARVRSLSASTPWASRKRLTRHNSLK